MPTESLKPGKIYIKTKDSEKIQELMNYECKEENNDDFIDAMKYTVKGITEGEVSMTLEIPKEKVRRILKLYGLETITRKRFKKLLMGCGMQRNDANILVDIVSKSEYGYCPIMVQAVIEWIIKEIQKGEE